MKMSQLKMLKMGKALLNSEGTIEKSTVMSRSTFEEKLKSTTSPNIKKIQTKIGGNRKIQWSTAVMSGLESLIECVCVSEEGE